MKARLLAASLAIFAMAASAYWVPTSIEQLAANSDCVIIGRVTRLTPSTNQYRVLVTLDVLSTLKQHGPAEASVTFEAPFTLLHCVVVMGEDGKPLPPDLNSFAVNDTCAVFLSCAAENHAMLKLVSDSDGKFTVDWATKKLWRSVMAAGDQNSLTLEAFAGLIHAGESLPRSSIQFYTAPTTATFWAPTPIQTLAVESDCVVIGRVRQIVPSTNRNRVTVTMGELYVLKGFEHAGNTVTFDAPLNMTHCYPFNFCTSNETAAVFLKVSREGGLSLIRDSDGKFQIDWPAQHLRRANLKADDGENSLSLAEFRKKVEAGGRPGLPLMVDFSRQVQR